MRVAFVMYRNIGEWLSPGVTATQSSAAAAAADSHIDADADAVDNDDISDGCLLEERWSSACTVVISHVVSLATSSSIRHSVHMTDPVTLTLAHIHVRIAFFVY